MRPAVRRMGASSSLSTPVAILLASMIIATGVYFGLRGPAPAASPGAAAEPPAPLLTPDRALVVQHALAALSYHRPLLLARCYRPALAELPAPIPAEFSLDLTFDARGVQLMRGVVELPGTSTPEITRCVGDLLPPLLIPPPGATVAVEVPLRFP